MNGEITIILCSEPKADLEELQKSHDAEFPLFFFPVRTGSYNAESDTNKDSLIHTV